MPCPSEAPPCRDSIASFLMHEADCAKYRPSMWSRPSVMSVSTVSADPATPSMTVRPTECARGKKVSDELCAETDLRAQLAESEDRAVRAEAENKVLRAQVVHLEEALERLRTSIITDLTALRGAPSPSKHLPDPPRQPSTDASSSETASPEAPLPEMPSPAAPSTCAASLGDCTPPAAVPVGRPSEGEAVVLDSEECEELQVMSTGKRNVPTLIGGTWRGRGVELVLLHEGQCHGKVLSTHIKAVADLRTTSRKCRYLAEYLGVVQLEKGLYVVVEKMGDTIPLNEYTCLRRVQRTPFKFSEILIIARRISVALQTLHTNGKPHRDLSSYQVLIDPTPAVLPTTVVKVKAYGLTRTPPLMEFTSPESIASRSFSKENDMWSLGVLLWELVTYGNVQALRGTTQDEVREEILVKAERGIPIFPKPVHTDVLWDEVIERCLVPTKHRAAIEEVVSALALVPVPRGDADAPIPIPGTTVDEELRRHM